MSNHYVLLTLAVIVHWCRSYDISQETTDDVLISFDFHTPTEAETRNGSLHRGTRSVNGLREGEPEKINACTFVLPVPDEMRSSHVFQPYGISHFYQKYIDAYGIPVIGSIMVSDNAMKRACYVLRYVLADRSDVRKAVYKHFGRVAVIARSQRTTQLPEYSMEDAAYYDQRRSFGAREEMPISAAGEENLLCDPKSEDRWAGTDHMLHMVAQMADLLGARHVISGWNDRLHAAYRNALSRPLWAQTYVLYMPITYFAEGVVIYLNSSLKAKQYATNKEEMEAYDPNLFNLIEELFLCKNTYIHRCDHPGNQKWTRNIRMDCDVVPVTTSPPPGLPTPTSGSHHGDLITAPGGDSVTAP